MHFMWNRIELARIAQDRRIELEPGGQTDRLLGSANLRATWAWDGKDLRMKWEQEQPIPAPRTA